MRFAFDHEPEFAELWDACVYNLLYRVDAYVSDLVSLFAKLGITKESKIIDVAAGGGFPSLELAEAGYQIEATDGFDDEVRLFNKKAAVRGIFISARKIMWADLPESAAPESYDLLLCRGNSFIYAGGGWNEATEVDRELSLKRYEATLKVFYGLLKPGGWIYLDKFMDSETSHREKVGEVVVEGSVPEDLIFWTERYPEQKTRRASMIRARDGVEKGVPNVTYDLLGAELELMLAAVGFTQIQSVSLSSETHFTVWIAKK